MNNNTIFENAIILSDFDGTFAYKAPDRDVAPQEDNLSAVEYFKTLGGHFTLSTGRLPALLPKIMPYYREVVNAPMIMGNGSLLFDPETGEIMEKHTIPRERAEELLDDVLTRFTPRKWYFYGSHGGMCNPPTDGDRELPYRFKMNFLFGSPQDAVAFRDYVRERHGARFNAFRSIPTCCEIVDRSALKSALVSRVKEILSRSEGKKASDYRVYVAGDFENDLNIIECADVSFCPSDALDEVKEAADHVLCSCSEGILFPMLEYIEENERMHNNG